MEFSSSRKWRFRDEAARSERRDDPASYAGESCPNVFLAICTTWLSSCKESGVNFQRNIQTGNTASSRKNSTLILCHRPPKSSWWEDPVPGNKCCNFVSRALFPGLEVGRAKPSKATLFITTFFCHVLSYHSSHYFNKSVRSFDSLGRRWRSTLASAHVLEISPFAPAPPPSRQKKPGAYVTNAKLGSASVLCDFIVTLLLMLLSTQVSRFTGL